jgi:hypothetical protein
VITNSEGEADVDRFLDVGAVQVMEVWPSAAVLQEAVANHHKLLRG